MKGDTISRSALEKTLIKHYGEDDRSYDAAIALTAVQQAPTVGAVPVVHGRWEIRNDGPYGRARAYCTACGKHSGIGGIRSNQLKPYCPNCGARMDGGEGE